ncbi:MAG: pilin [Candidatus Pacebacteria bacterium]|nr:pilin [Candidatus Paceibacterota bacterium]
MQPYTPLTNIGNFVSATPVDFPTYLNSMYKLGIAAAGVLAVIMIVVGGIQYMTSEAIGSKEEGKDRIWSAIWGLVLALMSFIILNTINPKLLNLNLSISQVNGTAGTPATANNQLFATSPIGTPNPSTGFNAFSPPNTGASGIQPIGGSAADQASYFNNEDNARAYLLTNGVNIAQQPCTFGQTFGCNNISTVGQSGVSGLVDLANNTGDSNLTVLGVTSPGIGKPIVNLQNDTVLQDYILSNYVQQNANGGYVMSDGSIFIDTGNSWSVVYP